MKRIGLIGGLSWQSSIEYYRLLNQMAADRLGAHHSAYLNMISLDHADFYGSDEDKKLSKLISAGEELKRANTDILLLCANGVHRFFDQLHDRLKIPMIHIADATAVKIKQKGLNKVGLVGVRETMELPFYKDRLARHGIETVIPEVKGRSVVTQIIREELILGVFKDSSRKHYLEIFAEMGEQGAEGVILGCTEIPLLIKQSDTEIPVFSTTDIHCEAVINEALA